MIPQDINNVEQVIPIENENPQNYNSTEPLLNNNNFIPSNSNNANIPQNNIQNSIPQEKVTKLPCFTENHSKSY